MGSRGTRSCAGPRGCQVVRAFPWFRAGASLGPSCIRVSKDRGCCCQSSGSATSPCRGDEVMSVASMNYDPIVSKVAEVLASGRTIRKREVE